MKLPWQETISILYCQVWILDKESEKLNPYAATG